MSYNDIMETTNCDRCGTTSVKSLNDDWVQVRALAWVGRPKVDLCSACVEAFDDWVRGDAPPAAASQAMAPQVIISVNLDDRTQPDYLKALVAATTTRR